MLKIFRVLILLVAAGAFTGIQGQQYQMCYSAQLGRHVCPVQVVEAGVSRGTVTEYQYDRTMSGSSNVPAITRIYTTGSPTTYSTESSSVRRFRLSPGMTYDQGGRVVGGQQVVVLNNYDPNAGQVSYHGNSDYSSEPDVYEEKTKVRVVHVDGGFIGRTVYGSVSGDFGSITTTVRSTGGGFRPDIRYRQPDYFYDYEGRFYGPTMNYRVYRLRPNPWNPNPNWYRRR